MLRFRKLISKDTLLRLYKAFIMPHFNYCSSVWHFCGACSTEKMDTLNKRILRFIFQGYNSPYDSLLGKVNSKSLYKRHLQTFLIILYKSLFFTCYSCYLRNMFSLRSVSYSLRGNYVSCVYRLQKELLMVFTPFHTWLQNYGTLFRILLERLNFLIESSA